MKKRLILLLAIAMLSSMTSCGVKDTGAQSPSASVNARTDSVTNAAPTKLTNKMTDYEKAYVTKRKFTLLDEQCPDAEIRIGDVIDTKEAKIQFYNQLVEDDVFTQEGADELIAGAEDTTERAAMINGVSYNLYVPPKGYDGGKLVINEETSFENKEAFYDEIENRYCKRNDLDSAETKRIMEQTKTIFEAVISGNYTEMPDRYKNHGPYETSFQINDPFADERRSWEYDSDALSAIQDHIDEYVVYDETLCIEFLVHVTLPPGYDPNKTYPVFFMTDGVWRLNDHAALYKAMENGEAADTLLVSLAYNYHVKGTDDQFRSNLFIRYHEELLRFITDDLMPYLCETYNINCADSTLLGHSMGGVFSHYALFNADSYENQPFGRYIIGSPAMFNLYNNGGDEHDAENAENDYGYFDRHDSLDKKVLLCGGAAEDPDFASASQEHDSILTSLSKMNERLSGHAPDLTYKLYDGKHHAEYVPEMLLEYLKNEYPVQ